MSLQRSLVKVSYTVNRGGRAWRAHGHYLSRPGAQREGAKGRGFDAENEDIYLPDRLDGWQRSGDERLWKIVISPEAGNRVDLRDHARSVVLDMERDLGTKLEWVAIDHHDTDHPHVHLAIRGVDDAGSALLLARDYVRSGIRLRSQEALTRSLGRRRELDRRLARERSIDAPRVTEIDRSLLARADAFREVPFDGPVPTSPLRQQSRLQDLARLRYLERLGLAESLGNKRWRLSPDLEPALRQIQISGDIQKSLARSRALITDRDAPVVLSRLRPGHEIRGRVAGAGLDEARDEPFLVLEGTDGQRHLVPQTAEIQRARGAGMLRPGTIVTLRSEPRRGRTAPRVEVVEHGRLRALKQVEAPSTLLDLEALRSAATTGRLPDPAPSRRGFFHQWRRAVIGRAGLLQRHGLLIEQEAGANGRTFEVSKGAERMVESRIAEQRREPVPLRRVEAVHGRAVVLTEGRPGQVYRGELVAYAEDEDGNRYAVLDTGRKLTAIPTERRDVDIGHEVRARVRAVAEEEIGERRRLAWTLDDIEHQRDRGHSR